MGGSATYMDRLSVNGRKAAFDDLRNETDATGGVFGTQDPRDYFWDLRMPREYFYINASSDRE